MSPYRAHSLLSPQFDPIEDSVDAEMSTNTLIKQRVVDERQNMRLLGIARGTWLMCGRRYASLLEVQALLFAFSSDKHKPDSSDEVEIVIDSLWHVPKVKH